MFFAILVLHTDAFVAEMVLPLGKFRLLYVDHRLRSDIGPKLPEELNRQRIHSLPHCQLLLADVRGLRFQHLVEVFEDATQLRSEITYDAFTRRGDF